MIVCQEVCPVLNVHQCCCFCDKRKECQEACQDHDPNKCGLSAVKPDITDLKTFENHYMAIFQNIADVVADKKKAEAKEAALKEQLKEAMLKHDIKQIDNKILKITYVAPSESHGVDTVKLKKEHPEIAAKYDKVTKKSDYIKVEVKEGEEK